MLFAIIMSCMWVCEELIVSFYCIYKNFKWCRVWMLLINCKSTNYPVWKGVVSLMIFNSNLHHFCHNINPNSRVHLLDIPNLLSVFFFLDMFWCTLLACISLTQWICSELCLAYIWVWIHWHFLLVQLMKCWYIVSYLYRIFWLHYFFWP